MLLALMLLLPNTQQLSAFVRALKHEHNTRARATRVIAAAALRIHALHQRWSCCCCYYIIIIIVVVVVVVDTLNDKQVRDTLDTLRNMHFVNSWTHELNKLHLALPNTLHICTYAQQLIPRNYMSSSLEYVLHTYTLFFLMNYRRRLGAAERTHVTKTKLEKLFSKGEGVKRDKRKKFGVKLLRGFIFLFYLICFSRKYNLSCSFSFTCVLLC